MGQLQALIFDVDGTLADTERDGHRVAFNRAFAEAGLTWEWSVELYGELLAIAGGKERIRFYMDRDRPGWFAPDNLNEWIAGLHTSKTAHYKQLLTENIIPLRSGVRRVITEARQQGIRLAIATTSAPENVMALLETALAPDSPDWFEIIAAGDIVPAKKPAPDVYQYVLEQLQLDPQHCLVIEDSPQGLKAALGANLPVVITVNGYTRHHTFPGAQLVIDQLGEPDLPFVAIAGDAHSATYFDVALADRLLTTATKKLAVAE